MSASPASRPDPVSPLVQRLVAGSGVLFGVLLVIAFLIGLKEPPTGDDEIAEWTKFANDNEADVRIGALVLGVAIYTFVLFLGYLRSTIGEAEVRVRGFSRAGYMVLIGGTLGIVGLALYFYLNALSIQHPETPPETIRALNALSGAGLGLSAGGFGACLVTIGLMNTGVRALPSWLGWVALAGGIAFVLQLGVLLSEYDDENVFGVFFPIAFLLLVVFAIGASVTWLRERSPGAPPPS